MMTDQDVLALTRQVGEVITNTGEMAISLAILTSEFKAHRELELYQSAVRAETCPLLLRVSELENDVDALAGVQRSMRSSIDVLGTWHKNHVQAEAIEYAEQRIIIAPLRWIAKNSEKVMLALVIAWLIYRFGF